MEKKKRKTVFNIFLLFKILKISNFLLSFSIQSKITNVFRNRFRFQFQNDADYAFINIFPSFSLSHFGIVYGITDIRFQQIYIQM